MSDRTFDGTFDGDIYNKLLRKIDWHVMPVLCATYSLQYYDKALLSQAAIFGLRKDLGLETGLEYSWASTIFYIGYIVGCYPASLLAQKFPTNRACSLICLAWGAVVMCTPACSSYHGFLVNRFSLGFIEAGVSPTFMLVVGLWYTKQEQVLRSAWWYSFGGGTNLISPLINYGLGHIAGGGLHPWQYMYFIAGVMTFVWGIALWWIFPGTPEHGRGFSAEELVPGQRSLVATAVLGSLRSFNLYYHRLRNGHDLGIFVFAGMGFTTFTSLLLNLPIGALAFICILGSGYIGAKVPHARLHTLAAACVPVILGWALIWKLPTRNRAGRIIGFYLIAFFSSAWIQCIGIGTANVAGHTKNTVYAAGTFIGYSVGNLTGPLMFNAKFAPRSNRSFVGMLIFFVIAMLVAELLRFYLDVQNRKRDEKYGAPTTEHGLEDLTDHENKSFRYSL